MQTADVRLIVAFFGGLVVLFFALMIWYSHRGEGFQIEMRNYSMGGVFGCYTVSRPLVFFAAALISMALFAGAVSRTLTVSPAAQSEGDASKAGGGGSPVKKDGDAGTEKKGAPEQAGTEKSGGPAKLDGKGGK
jgi:hypothetical protein